MNKKTIRIAGDTWELRRCPYCGSEDIIGHGVQHNGSYPKREKCKACGRTFNIKKGTIFYRKKMSRETILTIVYLFLTGYPISNMPPLVHVTERSIRNLLEEVITRFKKYEALIVAPSDYIPKIIEIDEIYIKIQGNREFYGWLAYDAENKYLIDFVTGRRDDDTLEKVFKKLKKYKGKTELVLIDAYKGYEKFIEKYLADGGKKPLTIECLNSQIRDLCNYMRRRSKRIPRLLSWGEKAISCFKFLHNFLKAHLTLSEKSSKNWITVPVTPCMNAGICNHQISLIEILTFRF
jgi:IS1 family transposase/transposase-like protein